MQFPTERDDLARDIDGCLYHVAKLLGGKRRELAPIDPCAKDVRAGNSHDRGEIGASGG